MLLLLQMKSAVCSLNLTIIPSALCWICKAGPSAAELLSADTPHPLAPSEMPQLQKATLPKVMSFPEEAHIQSLMEEGLFTKAQPHWPKLGQL